jgi:hypothetical protein
LKYRISDYLTKGKSKKNPILEPIASWVPTGS